MCETAGVRRTLHTYCRLLDERRLDDLVVEVYAQDAVDDRQRGEPLRGRQEIHDYFAHALQRLRATAHLLTNVDVTVDAAGQAATATSRVIALHWSDPRAPGGSEAADFVLVGSYADELRLIDGAWLIVRRTVAALGPTGLAVGALPQVFAGFGGRS
jgi:ketosteroid isomerase-like protein